MAAENELPPSMSFRTWIRISRIFGFSDWDAHVSSAVVRGIPALMSVASWREKMIRS